MPFCHPDEVKIGDRFRPADEAEVNAMVESMKECGQLQPILVTKDMELVDGLHRLLACKKLGREVWYEDEETGRLEFQSDLQRRRAELQANIRRKSFTPAELARGIAEIERLMREAMGSRRTGPGADEGWTQVETAKMLGYKSHTTVSNALIVARALERGDVPGLEKAVTMDQAVKMVRDAARIQAAKELAKKTKATDTEVDDPYQFFSNRVILGNCLEGMSKLAAGICDLFVTDPPWGIDIHRGVRRRGSAIQRATGAYEDSQDSALALIRQVVREMARVGKPNCYVAMFCAVKHWQEVAAMFREAGFEVYSKPVVWVKLRHGGKCLPNISKSHAPAIWPVSSYDAILIARRGNPTLARPYMPDVLLYPPVPPSSRIHQAQKPLALMVDLLSRFYHPGTNTLLIDPFVGSGSTLVAARRVGMKQYFGYEVNPDFRERAIAWMVQDFTKPTPLPSPDSGEDWDDEDWEDEEEDLEDEDLEDLEDFEDLETVARKEG